MSKKLYRFNLLSIRTKFFIAYHKIMHLRIVFFNVPGRIFTTIYDSFSKNVINNLDNL